jgi:hypothetical protein
MEVINMDAPPTARRLKGLVYGKSGTGKTNFGVSAPRPLILLNERQAIVNIRKAAERLKVPMPSVLLCKSVDDYRDVLRACHGDRTKTFRVMREDKVLFELATWPETIVLDSLTEVCELVAEEIREQSPPKLGKDGLPVDSERYWNVFGDRASKLIRAFRDVDLNVLYLCLLDDRVIGEGDDAHRWVGPSLSMRKLPQVVQAAVNVVGVTYRKLGKDKQPEYGVMTIGPDFMETKPFPPLRQYEVTNFASWCERINGKDDNSIAPSPASVSDVVAEPSNATASVDAQAADGPSKETTEQTAQPATATTDVEAKATKTKSTKKTETPSDAVKTGETASV